MFNGKKLKMIRVNAGLQQLEIAEKLGCKGTEIWRYEDGRVQPRPERIVQLANILNCRPDDFEDSHPSQQAGSGFSKDDIAIIETLLAMDPVRRAKIVGYIDGYIASGSRSVAALASDLAQTLESSPSGEQKRGRRHARSRSLKS